MGKVFEEKKQTNRKSLGNVEILGVDDFRLSTTRNTKIASYNRNLIGLRTTMTKEDFIFDKDKSLPLSKTFIQKRYS